MWDFNEKKLYDFRGYTIPARMMGGLERWIEKGILPGEFLQAVLENNLFAAAGRADSENMFNLPAYCAFLYNECPSNCFGSPEIVKAWQKHNGLEGMKNG